MRRLLPPLTLVCLLAAGPGLARGQESAPTDPSAEVAEAERPPDAASPEPAVTESGPGEEEADAEGTEPADPTPAMAEGEASDLSEGAAPEPEGEIGTAVSIEVELPHASDEPAEAEANEEGEDEAPARPGLRFDASVGGEYRLRLVAMSDIPLEPLPRTDPATTGRLGQRYWGEQWLRAHGELRVDPYLRLYGELDLLFGVAFGELAQGTSPAAWSRDEYGYPGLRLRQLYLEWLTPVGLVRVGQMGFSWGMGIVANGGDQEPVFGDYRFGDLVRRILFATKPAGPDSPFSIAVAGDWVAWDLIADFDGRGDLAFQGLVAGLYEEGDDAFGAYVAYRNQTDVLGEILEVVVVDAFVRWHFPEPSGGRILTELEVAHIRGRTTLTRTLAHPEQAVDQWLAAARVGRVAEDLDVILEGGFATGDANPDDGFQRRGTMDPDHRVGLILFPELMAWQSARSAHLAGSEELFARPARGVAQLPTNGGVAGAYYLFPYTKIRPLSWLELRFGAVLALASADMVDPYLQRARSQAMNARGGDPTRRDLGLEFDGAVLLRTDLAHGIVLRGGVEGAVLFPGRAFEDAEGRGLGPLGLGRLRVGLSY